MRGNRGGAEDIYQRDYMQDAPYRSRGGQTTVINNMAILVAIEEDILEVATIVVEAVISDTVDAVVVPVTMI